MTLVQFWFQSGLCFGLLLMVVVLILTGWLIRLWVRPRSVSEQATYIAASFYPLLLGITGAVLSVIHWIRILGDNGIANPAPYLVANFLLEFLIRLFLGGFLTCLYFPLGILTLLIRKRQ